MLQLLKKKIPTPAPAPAEPCAVTNRCPSDASFWATFWVQISGEHKASRPVACCCQHQALILEQSVAVKQDVSFTPFGGSALPPRFEERSLAS